MTRDGDDTGQRACSIFVLDYMPKLCCDAGTPSPMGSCRDHRLSSGREAVLRRVLGGTRPGHRSDPGGRLSPHPCARPLVTTHQALNDSTAGSSLTGVRGGGCRWTAGGSPAGRTVRDAGAWGRPSPLPCPPRRLGVPLPLSRGDTLRKGGTRNHLMPWTDPVARSKVLHVRTRAANWCQRAGTRRVQPLSRKAPCRTALYAAAPWC